MTMNRITSVTNPRVKGVVRLRDRKARAQDGWTIVEGRREMARAMEAKLAFKEIYVCRELLGSNGPQVNYGSLKIPVYETTKPVFLKMAYGDRAEGVLGLCAPPCMSLNDFPDNEHRLILIVEAVEKPGNLGAILRTCDGAGVDGVIICDGGTDIYNPNVIRASLGTVFSVPVAAAANEEALAYCREKGLKICAAAPGAAAIYSKTKLNQALAVVVGSEEKGLSDFWTGRADIKVSIPMRGRADSLNVAASTAILLYEIIRQRSA